jgi:hypothetical protein
MERQMRPILIMVGAVLMTLNVGAQDFDDPSVTVCELLIRSQFEIEQNAYRRLAADVIGARAVLDFEWGVPGAKPKAEHVECPFRLEDGNYVLDLPPDEESKILGEIPSISASGLYPIPKTMTSLQ